MAPLKGSCPHNKLRSDLENAVATLYAKWQSSRLVAKRFGIAPGTVLRIAHERGIARRPWGISEASIGKILDDYRAWRSGPLIAAELNVSTTTIYTHLDKKGCGRRKMADYDYEEDCNHEYFDRIDTADKAYWLGVLVTDGCISRQNEVILSLHLRDRGTVRNFRSALRSHAKISVIRQLKSIHGGKPFRTASASVRIRSRRLCGTLARHGILPGKTRSPRMVKGIPAKFESDFWRGAIDGDGWLCFGNRAPGNRQFILGFTGGLSLVKAFRRYCRRLCPTRAKIHPNHSVWRFVVTDWFAIDVASAIYSAGCISLPRKIRVFHRALRSFRSRTRQVRNWGWLR